MYGVGQVDGEQAERMWSRLAPFVGMLLLYLCFL